MTGLIRLVQRFRNAEIKRTNVMLMLGPKRLKTTQFLLEENLQEI